MASEPVYVDDELFLGRIDEQDRFRDVLQVVLAPQQEDVPPFIFLIHGEGGMGKSQLSRRLCDIALYEVPFEGCFHVLRVDWEEIHFHTPVLRVARDQIHPEDVLDALHCAALDKGWGRYFDTYQRTWKQRQQADQEVNRALDKEAGESRYATLRDLGADGFARLMRIALPMVGQTGEDLARVLLATGIQVGAEQAAQLWGLAEEFLRARLSPELYDIYRAPHKRLARALGDGLRSVSHNLPLVLLMDTYEIVALSSDTWLRQVIKTAGPCVLWVIAGRDNLAPSRAYDRYVGYSAEFPRRLTVWDVQELAIEYVAGYFQDRAPEREITHEEAAAIHRVTLGVPLALHQAADLWAKGVPLTTITKGIPDYAPRETIVRLMCERVLIHVEGEADRRALYALAMQPRPDPEVQAAILRTADSPFDLSARLAELVRRYSVVRLEGGARLHDAMGAFMWEYLLATEARASDLLRQIANVALDTLYARRAALELDLPTLADRVESVDWGQTTLDLVLWLFWRDERAAWHELIPRLVEGLGYSHSLVWGLLAASAAFGRALSQDGRRRLKHLVPNPENFGNLLDELEQLANKGWLDEEDVERANERWAVLQFLRGRWLTREGRYEEAQKTYLGAELMLPAGAAELRARLSDAYSDIGWKIGFRLGCHQEAIEAFDRAIELSRDSASAYRGRGNARRLKGDFSGAVSDLKEACQLQPDNVLILVDLAGALIDAGDAERGQQVAQEALSRLSETQVYFKAAMQGLIGNDDIALDLLELCLEADPSQGEWAQKDPDWRRFHSNPKYRALVGLPPLT